MLAGVDTGKARHVAIERALAAAMVEDDDIAVSAFLANELHLRITCRLDRRAGTGSVIHTLVHAEGAQNRVIAATKAGGQARIRNGHADKRAFERTPIGSEVFGFAVAHEAERALEVAIHGEGGGLHRAGVDQLAVLPGLIHHHTEAVVFAQIRIEVDVVLEHFIGELLQLRTTKPQCACRCK